MTRKLILLLLVIGSAATAQIQNPTVNPNETNRPGRRGIEIYPTAIVAAYRAYGINERLQNAGYPVHEPIQAFCGFGSQYRLNRLMVGLEGATTVSVGASRSNEIATAHRRSHFIQFTASYVAYRRRDLIRIYPLLTFGGMETKLTLSRATDGMDFDVSLRQPGNAVTLQHFSNIVNIGIGLDITPNIVGVRGMMSLRLGYRIGTRQEWYSDHTLFRGAPSDQLDTFFLQASFGGVYNYLSRRQYLEVH